MNNLIFFLYNRHNSSIPFTLPLYPRLTGSLQVKSRSFTFFSSWTKSNSRFLITSLSKISQAISLLVSTPFETKSFTPWNKVFLLMKQSVSHRETKCFKDWNYFWNLIAYRWRGGEVVALHPQTPYSSKRQRKGERGDEKMNYDVRWYF